MEPKVSEITTDSVDNEPDVYYFVVENISKRVVWGKLSSNVLISVTAGCEDRRLIVSFQEYTEDTELMPASPMIVLVLT